MVTTTSIASYPWQPESTITGNLAIGNLRENLLKSLETPRGIHSETIARLRPSKPSASRPSLRERTNLTGSFPFRQEIFVQLHELHR
jgi:hypothetical protein